MDTQSLTYQNQNKSSTPPSIPQTQKVRGLAKFLHWHYKTEQSVFRAMPMGLLYPLGRAQQAPETLFPRTGWHVAGF